MDEPDVKDKMRPVKAQLKKLKAGTDNLSREEKVAALKECVTAIGDRIEVVVADQAKLGKDVKKLKRHLWM